MLTPQMLDEMLERLQELVRRKVGEPTEALQNEQLSIVPFESVEQAIHATTLQSVAMANRSGGDIVLGISDDGNISECEGLDDGRLTVEVFNRTRPGIVVSVRRQNTPAGSLLIISVPEGVTPHATSDGTRVRRSGRTIVPITPDQDVELIGTRGELDFTDRPLVGARLEDLDVVQITYLREILRRKNDRSEMLELSDYELLQTLDLVGEHDVPKVAAVLLLGKRDVLRKRLPQAEVVYVHLDVQEEPDVQEQLYLPLLHTLSRLQDLIEVRNRLTTLRQGLFHFRIKDFDEEVCREALVNALVHRDYSRRDGAVYVVHRADRLEIANPGGLIGGVTVENILYHPPRHRNRRLAEVLLQLGLMERAGLGVNRLYRHLLRRGKEPPEYETTAESLRLTLHGGNLDEKFAAFIHEEEARGRVFSLDMLIILSVLRRLRTIDRASAARLSQRPDRVAGNTLNTMIDEGYLERFGVGRATAYRLSSRIHDSLGTSVQYFRDRGLSHRRHRALVMETIEELGSLSVEECQELCGLDRSDAHQLLVKLQDEGQVRSMDGRFVLQPPATPATDVGLMPTISEPDTGLASKGTPTFELKP